MKTIQIWKHKSIYVAVALLLAGCNGKQQEAGAKTIPVKIQNVSITANAGNWEYIRTIEEEYSSSLSGQGMGNVKQVLV